MTVTGYSHIFDAEESKSLFDRQMIILDEIRNNNFDLTSITCMEGGEVRAPEILLVLMSPYLANVIRTVEHENYSLILPDIRASDLSDLIESVLSACGAHSIKHDVILEAFDNVLWESGHLLKFIKKEEQEETLNEGPSVHENIKSEDSDSDCETFNTENTLDSTKDCIVKVENISCDKNNKILKSTPTEKSDKLIKMGSKEEKLSNYEIVKVQRKKRLKNEVDEVVPKKKVRKGERDKSQRVIVQKAAIILNDDHELLQDDEFKTNQANLRKDIEDVNNLEDPRLLWYRHHGLNPDIIQIKNQDKHPPLVCPICNLYVPPKANKTTTLNYGTALTGFFHHLQNYKYKNYVCPCKPEKDVMKHIEVDHWGWKTCHICSKVYHPSLESRHMYHTHKRPLFCQFCSKNISQQMFSDHMDFHYVEKTCNLCHVQFKGMMHREHHMQVVHLKEKFGCDKCHFICLTEEELRSHKENSHEPTDILDKEQVNITKKKTEQVCEICGVSVLPRKYHYHMSTHRPRVDCPVCSKKVPQTDLKRHIKLVHNPSVCTVCGVEVKRLRQHMIAHHLPYNQSKYKCDLCRKGFPSAYSLNTHNMNVHLKLRPFKCRYGCEFAYNDNSNRNAHEKKKHGQIYTKIDNKDGTEIS